MNTVSFMGANLVAQQLDWAMTEGWSQGAAAANDHYRPIATFQERFGSFVQLAVDAGFSNVDVWTGQLNWTWATAEHFAAARSVLDELGVKVTSYAGSFGETPEEFGAAASVAVALGAPILSGTSALLNTGRDALIRELTSAGLVFAIENHPEKTPAEMIAKIGDGAGGMLGTAVDTGWWATQGYDAADAIRSLGAHLVHVHLKDIRAAGAHDTCALGDGIANIESCVEAMREAGFSGPISIEHEPEHYDPMPEVIMSRQRLAGWLDTSRR
ncbi:sugar phosphate isomerase/epimerase family protein [Lysobacter korlensis]|uniref:Sugar phosphate isomerase/epimerase family protein n=1 Tax=Lysobacter korlensis TaxID=553636 RepID=A0ABV6RT19_9GAMM